MTVQIPVRSISNTQLSAANCAECIQVVILVFDGFLLVSNIHVHC